MNEINQPNRKNAIQKLQNSKNPLFFSCQCTYARQKLIQLFLIIIICFIYTFCMANPVKQKFRRLPAKEYIDKMKAGWIGLKCIPHSSQYHECISDVLKWYKENPVDWEKTWHLINEKYHKNHAYRRFSCRTKARGGFNIDAKINGAYIVMGLLYGKGNLDKTIIISTCCKQPVHPGRSGQN